MMAFLFTLVLFTYWGAIGFAVTTLFPPRLRVIQGILISPTVGIVTTILPVFLLNRMGYPIKDFALPLAITLLVTSLLIFTFKRPLFPTRQLRPYAAVLIMGLLLSAWPMLLYGFDWVSYANDDMANYTLGAQRFFNHGFMDKPNLDVLLAGKDYSLAYWFFHVITHSRPGSELMLAMVWGVSGLNSHQIFMPVIMTLNLALLASAGALASGRGGDKKIPLIAMGLLAISPLNTLGALYQLIAQVGGMGILCAAITLTYRQQATKPFIRLVVRNVPAILVLMAFTVWYPEALPFFGAGWLVYVLMTARRSYEQALKVILPAVLIGIIAVIVLNRYVITMFFFSVAQIGGGFRVGDVVDVSVLLFPYFLMPSGIPGLWGILSIISHTYEPWLSLIIAAGLLLSGWFLTCVLPRELKRLSPPAIIAAVMVVVGLSFYYRIMDFVLFKLAMYFQPFFCCVIATSLIPILHKKSWARKLTVLLALMVLSVQLDYVNRSTGEVSGGLTELPHASANKINRQFDDLIHSVKPADDTVFVTMASNVVLAKFQMLYSEGYKLLFTSNNYMLAITSDPSVEIAVSSAGMYDAKIINDNQFITLRPELLAGEKVVFIPTEGVDIFNHYQRSWKRGDPFFSLQPEKEASNLLAFTHSLLGPHYYSYGDKKKIAFFQLESDPMFPGASFSALGRHLLFRVFNPTPHPRLVMELTDTVVKQFTSALPSPDVQGTTVGFIGRGTGRVFSEPLDLTPVDGVPYLSVDMRRDGKMFPDWKHGLMLLYGRDIPTDRRRITAFGRNISLVSEEQYQALTPPASLQHFPEDLADKNLEYSGIYEDGWISERSFFMLKPDGGAKFFVVKGVVPYIGSADFHSSLQVSIDGKPVATQSLTRGDFEIKLPVTVSRGKHRIDLSFDHYQVLPYPDSRPTGGKIIFIGYTND